MALAPDADDVLREVDATDWVGFESSRIRIQFVRRVVLGNWFAIHNPHADHDIERKRQRDGTLPLGATLSVP